MQSFECLLCAMGPLKISDNPCSSVIYEDYYGDVHVTLIQNDASGTLKNSFTYVILCYYYDLLELSHNSSVR